MSGVLRQTIPLWKSKWPESELRKKCDEIGPREFARGWRQQALVDDELLFQPKFIEQCLDHKRVLMFPGDEVDQIAPKSHGVYMGVDLAIAGSASAGDYFCIVIISVDPKHFDRKILGVYRDRGITFNTQIETIQYWSSFFNPSLIFVESNAYQASITQELNRTTDLPVKAFTTTSLKKSDLDNGLPRLSVELENTRWSIPYAEGATRDMSNLLISELKSYPIGRHDDILMALWFARCAAAHVDTRVRKRIKII